MVSMKHNDEITGDSDSVEITEDIDSDEMNEEEKEKISRFIHLFLNMMLRGFDEMEMQKRLELVNSLGVMLEFGFNKTCGRMIDFEKRLQMLEGQINKKK